MVLSITSASQELALQEHGETLKGLEQAVEAGRRALEVERKQVEGKLLFISCFTDFPLEDSPPFLIPLLLDNFKLAHRTGARGRAG
jgi:hypothetical protein